MGLCLNAAKKPKIGKITGGLMSIFFLGTAYCYTQDAMSHFKKALTYRHELEKEVVVLDVIINYLKNEIALQPI